MDNTQSRRQSFQSVAWFWDQYKRGLLDLDPPYQRRSVWNQAFKDFFIDTVLLRYPAPALFLYEDIKPDGTAKYAVVDGKQRLTTLFEFAADEFPVSQQAELTALRGKLFSQLPDNVKKSFWTYQFSVEYLPSDDESLINSVFDRINRNTARLTPQELRHAKYSGPFITAAEDLTEWLASTLRPGFPNIATQSRAQMKDVELVAQLLLCLDEGPRGYSSLELDAAFAGRDVEWPGKLEVTETFRRTIGIIKELLETADGRQLAKTRLRNQADFYSLFAACASLAKGHPPIARWRTNLLTFMKVLEDDKLRARNKDAQDYYDAARSASNDTGPRTARIRVLKKVMGQGPRKAKA